MKIRQTILVGAGGTGGWLAEPLARMLSWHPDAMPFLTVVDKDKFEARNGDRQAGAAEGAMKASSLASFLAARIGTRNPPGAVGAVEEYIEGSDLLSIIAERDYRDALTPQDGVVCVILAVDNDFTRAALIEALEGSQHDYLIVNPGNGFDSFMLSTQARVAGVKVGGSLRERFPQYVDPPLDAPQHAGCKVEVESSPQLLTANLGSAWASLCAVEGWLSDQGLPLGLSGTTRSPSVADEGNVTLPGWDAVADALGASA